MAKRLVRGMTPDEAFVFFGDGAHGVAFTGGTKVAMLKGEPHQHFLTSAPESSTPRPSGRGMRGQGAAKAK